MGRYDGGKTYRGENFTGGTDVVGHVINKVTVNLGYYGGSITGNCYVVIVKSDFSEIQIGDAFDVSVLTSSLQEFTFTNDDNTYVMQEDDMVCLKYDKVINFNSGALMTQYSTNTFADSDYCYKEYSGSTGTWTLNDSTLSGCFGLYEGDTPVSTGSVTIPPPIAVVSL